MQEIVPGVRHWTAFHPRIGQQVHSYWVPAARAVIDPMLPEGGTDAFTAGAEPPPERILLTNRHHWRHSGDLVEAFGCTVHCHEAGLHEFADGRAVEGFRFGDELAPGIVAREVGALTPEETVLHIDTGPGLLAFADAVIRGEDGELSFVPDFLLGDDPAEVKRGLRAAFSRLLSLDFDGLLLAHGAPLPGGGRAALAAMAEG